MIQKVSNQVKFPEIEAKISEFWKENRIFEKSIEQRPETQKYTFMDGPPFVSGNPHYASLLPSIAKDVVPRYWTMKGKRVRRVFGWDCHGLPIEEKINAKFDLKTKEDIEAFGINKYIGECRTFIEKCTNDWRWYIDKIGRWVDIDNAYYTMKPEFNQSVIWFYKQAYDKGLIYKGKRVSMFSTDTSTPVSEFEVGMDPDNYRDVEDLSIFVKFKAKIEFKGHTPENLYMLAWTTTPWTIPANVCLAVDSEIIYTVVLFEGSKYILAKSRLEATFQTDAQNIGKENGKLVQILDEFAGSELEGIEYEPVYDYFVGDTTDKNFKVYLADFVTDGDGTGIVHSAGTYGKEDFDLCKKYEVPMFEVLDIAGILQVGPWKSVYLRDAFEGITADLQQKGNLLRSEKYTHRLPFYRGKNPLIYTAQESYFINVQSIKDRMIELNQTINWYPEHFQNGRFLDVISNAPDWCISRNRYWATIMPLWVADDGEELVIGSFEEMKQYNAEISVKEESGSLVYYFRDKPITLHRDVCDEIILTKNGKDFTRVPEVLDCWMDSGSVPFAEHGYPFNPDKSFEEGSSADFIVEYTGQLRAWFNILLRVSVIAFDEKPFKNAVVTGVLAGNDGRKMSKSFGNFPDPKEVLENIGGEALRLYLMSSPIMVSEDMAWSDEILNEQLKAILIPFWNTYSYLCLYMDMHSWAPSSADFSSTNILDIWVKNLMDKTTKEYGEYIENFDIPSSVKLIQPCIDNISTWWIRRSRDRFAAGDKEALQTLYSIMVQLIKTFAPQMPFLCEEMYQNLVVNVGLSEAKESIHLEFYPEIKAIDLKLLVDMDVVREICSLGLSIRTDTAINLRQPLAKAITNLENLDLVEIIKKELNVKTIEVQKALLDQSNLVSKTQGGWFVALDTELSPELKEEGMVNEITRVLQNARKTNGFKMGELVKMQYFTDNQDLQTILEKNNEVISQTVSASELNFVDGLTGEELKIKGGKVVLVIES